MSYLVAVEQDAKSFKEIKECWTEVAAATNNQLLMFKSLEDLKKEFEKAEMVGQAILLLLVCFEEVKSDPKFGIEELKMKYKCNVLLSMFDDPLKSFKKPEALPVHNIIYRPFDLTILKEHTRFALLHSQQVKTQYVHTTEAETQYESVKKFQILQLSEFGFKIDRKYKLEAGKSYKFYHPMFANQKQQHIWGRVSCEDNNNYEVMFCQVVPTVINQIRKKVSTTSTKVRKPVWQGFTENKKISLVIGFNLKDEPTALSLADFLERNFKEFSFIYKNTIDPKQKIDVDLWITDVPYTEGLIKSQFNSAPIIFRLYNESISRKELEEQFLIESIRFEKTFDKAFLIKAIKMMFPATQEKEDNLKTTVDFNEITSLSEVMNVTEFSEAAVAFLDKNKRNLDENVDFALPQEDEALLKELKGRVHYVDEKPNQDGLYLHQLVLFGMKDEFLKLFRLWALQMHIIKNKDS
jgi:hypothetical protein